MSTSSRRSARGLSLAAFVVTLLAATAAHADPIVGEGTADIDPAKGVVDARRQATARARKAALDLALGGLTGPVDNAAKKSVRKHSEAWTGAYRILSQSADAKKVAVRLEVDIDTVRLGKRVAVAKDKVQGAAYSLGAVEIGDACGQLDAAHVGSELGALAAVSAKGAQPAAIEVDCVDRGPVRFTHMHAAKVTVVARTDAGVVATSALDGFGSDAGQAMEAALQEGLEAVSTAMRAHRRGRVRIRVLAPLPAARVRRLETAMRNSVAGVDDVSVAAIEPGVAVLAVDGELSAKDLGRRLEALRLPGFSVTISSHDDPDVLTVRLD